MPSHKENSIDFVPVYGGQRTLPFVTGTVVDVNDLVFAHNTGKIRTWKNQGDGTFAEMPNPSCDYLSYPMGIGIGDVNNDGLPVLECRDHHARRTVTRGSDR